MRSNPCPANGNTRGACPDWQIDHKVPMCVDGPLADRYENLQWLTVAAHKAKTRDNVRLCRLLRG
jgi:hypothetical protein